MKRKVRKYELTGRVVVPCSRSLLPRFGFKVIFFDSGMNGTVVNLTRDKRGEETVKPLD